MTDNFGKAFDHLRNKENLGPNVPDDPTPPADQTNNNTEPAPPPPTPSPQPPVREPRLQIITDSEDIQDKK